MSNPLSAACYHAPVPAMAPLIVAGGEEEQAKSMAVAQEGSFGARLRRLREAAGLTTRSSLRGEARSGRRKQSRARSAKSAPLSAGCGKASLGLGAETSPNTKFYLQIG